MTAAFCHMIGRWLWLTARLSTRLRPLAVSTNRRQRRFRLWLSLVASHRVCADIGGCRPTTAYRSFAWLTPLWSNGRPDGTSAIGPKAVWGRGTGMFCDGSENGGCSQTALTLCRTRAAANRVRALWPVFKGPCYNRLSFNSKISSYAEFGKKQFAILKKKKKS